MGHQYRALTANARGWPNPPFDALPALVEANSRTSAESRTTRAIGGLRSLAGPRAGRGMKRWRWPGPKRVPRASCVAAGINRNCRIWACG